MELIQFSESTKIQTQRIKKTLQQNSRCEFLLAPLLGIHHFDVGKIDDELINYSDKQSMTQESRQLPRNR